MEELYNFNSLDIFVNKFINKDYINKLDLINVYYDNNMIDEIPAFILKNNCIIISQNPKSIEIMYGFWDNIKDKLYFICKDGYMLFHYNITLNLTINLCEKPNYWYLHILNINKQVINDYEELFYKQYWDNFDKSFIYEY